MVLSHENGFAMFSFTKPILTITVKKSRPTPSEWEWTKQTMVIYYKTMDFKKYQMSIIFDLRKFGIVEPGIFTDWVAFFQEYREYTRRCIYRTSIITDNMTIKIGLNLFFSLYTMIRPMKFTSNITESHEFVTTEHPKLLTGSVEQP